MRAVQFTSYGGPEVVTVTGDAPRPSRGEGQVLVEVRAASLNPIDLVVRSGMMKEMVPLELPATLGGDFAGVVTDPGGSSFRAGDEVYGQAGLLLGGSGSIAELVAAPAGFTAPKPKSTAFDVAASLPLVGASAVQAIVDHMNVQRGQRILIHGAAGGVGSIAVQVAKHLGAYVIGTAFAKDTDYVTSLGADEVIDPKKEAFETVVRDLDGVLDLVRGDTAEKSYGVIRRGGVLVSLTAEPDEARMQAAGVRMVSQLTQPTTERLMKLAALVDAGVVKPNVERTFPLDQAVDAFHYFENGNPRGKVVLTMPE